MASASQGKQVTGETTPAVDTLPQGGLSNQLDKEKKKFEGNKTEDLVKDKNLKVYQTSLGPPIVQSRVLSHSGNPLGSYCLVKLNHENYLFWKNLVLPIIRGNWLEGYIIGAKQWPFEFVINTTEETLEGEISKSPEFQKWMVQDQILLRWLYNFMEADIAIEVMGIETSKGLWDAIRDLFGVKNRSNAVFFKIEF